MKSQRLQEAVAEAARLAGFDFCADGHAWESFGGRTCPWFGDDVCCSQAVYRCARCGEVDYGDPGGPGFSSCHKYCLEGLKDFSEEEAAELLKP